MSFSEECWILQGARLSESLWVWREKYVSVGTGASVDFDWETAWDDPTLVGWRHTHPGLKFDFPSSVDHRTMKSWVKAQGRPMMCGVTCADSTRYFLYYRRVFKDIVKVEMRWRRFCGFVWASPKGDKWEESV